MMGGEELLRKIQLHTEKTYITLGRARLHSYRNMYRSNLHLEVFQGFQMITLNSWAYFVRFGQWEALLCLMVPHPNTSL